MYSKSSCYIKPGVNPKFKEGVRARASNFASSEVRHVHAPIEICSGGGGGGLYTPRGAGQVASQCTPPLACHAPRSAHSPAPTSSAPSSAHSRAPFPILNTSCLHCQRSNRDLRCAVVFKLRNSMPWQTAQVWSSPSGAQPRSMNIRPAAARIVLVMKALTSRRCNEVKSHVMAMLRMSQSGNDAFAAEAKCPSCDNTGTAHVGHSLFCTRRLR